MATVLPVSFGLSSPKSALKNTNLNTSSPSATSALTYSDIEAVPNQKSALAVLLTSAILCTVAVVNLIKAGR